MNNIIKIIRIAKPLYRLIFIISCLIIFSSIIGLINPFISREIINRVVESLSSESFDFGVIIALVGVTFLVDSFSTLLNSTTQRLGDHFAGEMRKFLTERFYDKVLTLPQTYFDSSISGKIVNQLNRGIFTIQSFINSSTNFILPNFALSILIITVLTLINPLIGFLTFILFPIYIFLTKKSAQTWGKEEVLKNAQEDKGRGRVQEVISNIKVVKGFTNEKNEFSIIENIQSKINEIYARQSNTFHFYDFLRSMSLNIVLGLVSLIVFYNTYLGIFSVGDLFLILQFVNIARRPLFAISFILTQLQLAESGSKEYFEVLDLESKEDYSSIEKVQILNKPNIEFRNVTFEYEENKDHVLDNVSFKIDHNEKVALVGMSGAGKSTTINLITKLYEPVSGDILIAGKKYSELSHKEVRENISLVFQENELFSSTIRENVAYGMDDATDDQVIDSLKKANAYEFVMKQKDGINAQIGERGIKLSGGQKQRIQIARAILKNSPILILDEATSSLDSKSELQVQEALENLMENKLTIIIAHRFSTIQNVDRIIVLNNGKIEDEGTPKELASRKGTYSELLRYQVEGNKKLLANYEIF